MADAEFAPFSVMATPAATAPLTVPEMLYVVPVSGTGVKFTPLAEPEPTFTARLAGMKV